MKTVVASASVPQNRRRRRPPERLATAEKWAIDAVKSSPTNLPVQKRSTM